MTTLNPKNGEAWCSFLDLLKPPVGYELEAGLGTTFGLSLEMLVAVLLGFIDLEPELTKSDVAASLRAIGRLSRRLRVFVERGTIDAEETPRPIHALLDRMVVEVALPKQSGERLPAFHPKVWALLFQRRNRPELRNDPGHIVRVVCASKNLTESRLYELGIALEGSTPPKGEPPSELGRDLRAFFGHLLGFAKPLGSDLSRRLGHLLQELAHTRFETSRECSEALRLSWSAPGKTPLRCHLPKRGRRALVVSPFLTAGLVSDLSERFEHLTLVSRQDAFDNVFTEQPRDARELLVMSPVADDELSLGQLHAKLLILEDHEGTTTTFLGSANATTAAWGSHDKDMCTNCEAVVQLRPGLKLATVRQELRDCAGIVTDYSWLEPKKDDKEIQRQELADWARLLARIPIRMAHNRATRRLSLAATSTPPQPTCVTAKRARTRVVPLLLQDRGGALQPFEALWSGGILYEEVELANVSRFVVLRVAIDDIEVRKLLTAEESVTDSEQDERDDAIRACLLENLDPRDVLRSIIFGARTGLAGTGTHEPRAGHGGGGRVAWLEEVNLENLLEACTESDATFEEVDQIVRAYAKTERLDPGFAVLWRSFRAARQTVLREDAP